MKSNRTLVILNALSLALVLAANYIGGAGLWMNKSVGDVSHKYDTLFAPAGYAFTIWLVIFLLCIAFVIRQWTQLRKGMPQVTERTGPWFLVANLANIAWLYCWLTEQLALSVIVIMILLVALCIMAVRLRLELDDEPVFTIFFTWWPIAIYLGWILVATIACIAAWLVSIRWHGAPLNETAWTIIVMAIATGLYLLLIQKRNLRETAAVGVWAFVAIAVRQWNGPVAIAAGVASIVLLIAIVWHSNKNKKYVPAEKIKRGEW